MLIGVISDIHGNLVALEAVLHFLGEQGVRRVWCAGDIVGYGPQPRECMEAVAEKAELVVMGNHEAGILEDAAVSCFNALAKEVCAWTREELGSPGRGFVAALPLVARSEEEKAVVTHSDLSCPEFFDYISCHRDLKNIARKLVDGEVCFVGHSHGAFVARLGKGVEIAPGGECVIGEGEKAVVNVGSVGQPRDGDPRASCAVFEPEGRRVVIHRVWYDVEEAAQRACARGLPSVVGERLLSGR